jgi:hypothetical protein
MASTTSKAMCAGALIGAVVGTFAGSKVGQSLETRNQSRVIRGEGVVTDETSSNASVDAARGVGGNDRDGDVLDNVDDSDPRDEAGQGESRYMPESLKHIRDSSKNSEVFQLLFDMISVAHASDCFKELTSVCDRAKSLLDLYGTVHAKSTTIVPMMQRKASIYVASIKRNLRYMTTKVVHDKPQFEDMTARLDEAVTKIMQNILAEVSLKMA